MFTYYFQILCNFLVELSHSLLHVILQDNPLLDDYNVEQRVNDFINAAMTQVKFELLSFSLIMCFSWLQRSQVLSTSFC
jgi:hypothetical protein